MYTEHYMTGNQYRREYLEGLEKLIKDKQQSEEQSRNVVAEKILSEPDIYRLQLKEMLGWPLNLEQNTSIPEVSLTFVAKDGDISIYRMQIDVLGVPFYGILFVKEDGKRRPLVISQHGALGFPELNSDLLSSGSSNYNRMTRRILEYDVNVFAPQLFLWTKPQQILGEGEETTFGDSYEKTRRRLDECMKQLGGSMVAFEIYSLMRTLDYFAEQPFVEADKMGMVGMSYGGFYTLYTAAVDTRLKTNICCSFYNNRLKYTSYDWAIKSTSYTVTDNQAVMLTYPRGMHLVVGSEDALFDSDDAVEEYEKLVELLPQDHHVTFEVFEGNHEFVKNDNALTVFMQELFE